MVCRRLGYIQDSQNALYLITTCCNALFAVMANKIQVIDYIISHLIDLKGDAMLHLLIVTDPEYVP